MIALLFAAAIATPTMGDAQGATRFINRDGVRAQYVETVDANGVLHLTGRYLGREQTSFHYKVKRDHVDATVGAELGDDQRDAAGGRLVELERRGQARGGAPRLADLRGLGHGNVEVGQHAISSASP